MFTQEELNILLSLLNRVTLNGSEAETVVYLKNKIRALQAPKSEPKTEE